MMKQMAKEVLISNDATAVAGQTVQMPSVWTRFIRQWDFQLMILPAILFLIVFSYGPMYGILLAFKEYNLFKGFADSPWVGTMHFRMFYESPEFWSIIRNTFVIALLKLFIGFPAPIILALMLNEVGGVFKRVVQTVTYIPHFMSWIVISGLAFSMLAVDNGAVNELLLKLHLVKEPINWMSEPKYFWGILVGLNVWKEIGFGSIVYLAAIIGIDPALYESASLDGASRFKQIFLITLPSIMPIMIIFLILGIGNILSAGYEDILVLTRNLNNGIMLPIGNVLDTYVYQMGVLNQRYSYASAVGLFKSVLSVILLVIANMTARRFGNTSLW